jgi:hypothetical protein
MARVDTTQTTAEPWMEYLPAGASPEMVNVARQAWTAGYRPTWNTQSGTWDWGNSRGTQGQPSASAGTPPSPAAVYPAGPEAPAGTPNTPVQPSIADLVTQDPEWLARIGAFAANRHDIVTNYGAGAGLPGVDTQTAADAAANPHSVLALLGQQRQTNDIGLSNQAQMHHASLSGANVQTHLNEASADEGRHAAALSAVQNQLQGVANSQDELYWNIYHRLAANPPQVGTAPGDPQTAGVGLPGSLPVPGNTSTAGGVRTIGDQSYIVQNPNIPDTEKRPYVRPPTPTPKRKKPTSQFPYPHPGTGL